MDSSGLGPLISGYMTMKKVGGHFQLLHLKDRLMKLLVLTKVNTVFETFDSETTAISSFFSGSSKQFSLNLFSLIWFPCTEGFRAKAILTKRINRNVHVSGLAEVDDDTL